MVDAYLQACDHGYLDRQWTVDTLAAGLRRALQEEPTLIGPYAESLAFLSPKEYVGLLEEATAREDVDFFLLLEDLRRMRRTPSLRQGYLQNTSPEAEIFNRSFPRE